MPDKEELFADIPEAGELSEEEKKGLKNLSIAQKAEKSRLEKAKEELERVRAERKKTEEDLKKIEAGEEIVEPPKEVVPAVNVEEAVKKELEAQKRKDYLDSVVVEIKKMAKTRQEAIEAYDEAVKLPPTGNAKMDAEFAFNRVQRIKEDKRGFVAPSVGGSFNDLPESGTHENGLGISKGQMDHARTYGLTEDDIKKHKAGVDFTRLFKH